ncbi:translocation/assembly module TamB domain-containing protein [Acidocella aromatica]|uniref:Translocation and assembly module TamB n=1 Tax=Acidocella aromatica TaxID=1303579 RepID=A0A840VEC7_9PROT|nr:translocation/assembly module TamB domain-containing protein [Acidocella aromatica]MBB5373227.1 translocation and assembly module TamB [Acidocella aromatica]
MRRALYLLLALLLLPVLAVTGLCVALNTGGGRHFAEAEINSLAGPTVHVTGLAGHFPADLKLSSLTLADKTGPWLTGISLELRWRPLQLLLGTIAVERLSANTLTITRAPAPSGKSGGGGVSLPSLHVQLGQLAIGTLNLPASLAGENVALHVNGSAALRGLARAAATLDATTPNSTAQYHLTAALGPKTAMLSLHVSEPPHGLLGHYAGPSVSAPLLIDAALSGPRDASALTFAASLGSAKLTGTGTLNLTPRHPGADVTFMLPDITPFAALAGKSFGGTAQLHLTVAGQSANNATLALDGKAAIANPPKNLAKLLGAQETLTLRAKLHGNAVTLENFQLTGPVFAATASGRIAAEDMDLATGITFSDISALSPGISGAFHETGHITGKTGDYALAAELGGNIAAQGIPSAPFDIKLNLSHLSGAPTGTITGSGAVENAPLTLDAALTHDDADNAALKITTARWRSLDATADLHLAKGAALPTGTANLAITALQDFAPFLPLKLRGAVHLALAHPDGQDFKLDATASGVQGLPSLGALDATLHAQGPETALTLQTQLQCASVENLPASASLAATLNLPARSAHLTRLTASWHGLTPSLLGPADITTQNGLVIRHLSLAVAGGRLGLDGTLTPTLAATTQLQNLPLSAVKIFDPSLDAAGTITASANLTGTLANPGGKLSLNAQALHLNTGAAASLPPASLTGIAALNAGLANLDLAFNAGPSLAFTAKGAVPVKAKNGLALHLDGTVDLRLLDAIIAAQGSIARGKAETHLYLTGTLSSPHATGTLTLADGSVQNIGSGLNLTNIQAQFLASGQTVTLQSLTAQAGKGQITSHGTLDLAAPGMPVDIALHADNATPTSSDLVTETLNGDLALQGQLRGNLALSGKLILDKAVINIPHALPPSVAKLTILRAGETPPPPPAPPPPIALALDIRAKDQIFIYGQGLFAVLGGRVRITGTADNPTPQGGFELVRGDFSLAGKTLQFTQGRITFTGAGFMPTLDLEATTTTSDGTTATLIIGGTAEKPTITLTSSPSLPSDEILARLLFGEGTANLSPFQAASLAAALAQLSGLGAGLNPLDKMRNVLGLDELSLGGGNGSGAPSVQAGRYVAPGVYVGATQSTTGQGTQADVQINLYKGLKLQTSTGTSTTTGGQSSSVGITYQFNY